jgi:hypothetical protein
MGILVRSPLGAYNGLVRYSECSVPSGGGGMRFVLTYDGPLPPNNTRSGIAQKKHDIRRVFHPQLKRQ